LITAPESIKVTIEHLKGKNLGRKLEGIHGNYRVIPKLFDSVDVDSDISVVSANNKPWTPRYLKLLLDSFNEHYGGPKKDLVATIKEILQFSHPKGASYLPSTTIYRRLWNRKHYNETPPTGACGYFMCDQALRRSRCRQNLSLEEKDLPHYPRLIDDSAKKLHLTSLVDKKHFVAYFDQAVELVDNHLKTASAEEAYANPLLGMLRSFREKELVGVKDWLHLNSVGGSKYAGYEPHLPQEYWFDSMVLPFIFRQPDVVNLTVFRLSSNIEELDWGTAEQSSHSMFLRYKESADFATYRDIIIPNMNYFAYDGIHFWLIPTYKDSEELRHLDLAYDALAVKVISELAKIHQEVNMGHQYSAEISDIVSTCKTSAETRDQNDSSAVTDATDLAITAFPSSIRVHVGSDEKQDKFFKRHFINADSSIAFYGRFVFGSPASKLNIEFYSAYVTCAGQCITVGDVIRIDERDYTLLFISSQSSWPCLYLIKTSVFCSKFENDPDEVLSRMVSDITGRLTNGFESVTVWSQSGLDDSDKLICADNWLLNEASFGSSEINRAKFKALVLMTAATFASYLTKNRCMMIYIKS